MRITPILVPYDHDVARWCTASGPQALIDGGLLDRIRCGGHTVEAPSEITLPRAERTRDSITNLGRIGARLSQAVAAAVREPDGFALVLAGNCPHAVGAVGGLARAGFTPGIVWYDAHGDLNTFATTETGFIGGLPFVALGWDLDDWRLACGLEHPVRPEAAALIGANDLDAAEVAALDRHPIARLDAAALDADGQATLALLGRRATEATAWSLHLDIDVVGPEHVPGATTPSLAPADGAAVLASLRAAGVAVPLRACTLATYHAAGDPERRGLPYMFAAIEAVLAGVDARRSAA